MSGRLDTGFSRALQARRKALYCPAMRWNVFSRALRRDAGLSLLVAGLLSAVMLRFALTLRLNYDEIAEFHAIWQVSQGHKPYVDFYYDHPPYFWVLYSPLLGLLPETFRSLVALRAVNVAFSFAALAQFLFLLQGLKPERSWKGCALAAAGLMTLQLPMVFTFSQFRADHLALALNLAGLLTLERGPREREKTRWALTGFFYACSALLTPKLVLLQAASILVYGLDRALELRRFPGRELGALLGGTAAGFAALNVLALAAGVDPVPFYSWALRHHLHALALPGYRFGLARALLLRAAYNPLIALVVLGGAAAAARELWRAGWRRQKVLVVALAFCLLQPLWVKYLGEQYLYTVLLAWSVPFALFLHGAARVRSVWLQLGVSAPLLAAVWFGLPEILAAEREQHSLREQLAQSDALLRLAPAGRPVSMQPPHHVVFRENSTYFFNYTIIPAGPGTEDALQGVPGLGKQFTYPVYLEQLERRPPSLILLNPAFAGRQYLAAAAEFLRRRAGAYEKRSLDGVEFYVRTRDAKSP